MKAIVLRTTTKTQSRKIVKAKTNKGEFFAGNIVKYNEKGKAELTEKYNLTKNIKFAMIFENEKVAKKVQTQYAESKNNKHLFDIVEVER